LVSAIIPARNEEASIARAVESVAAQAEVGEVIVVNDQSTDRTAEILAELGLRIPKLRVLETETLPAGWTGKNYALSVGATAARGDWLLFTDADTYHLPGSTARALADATEHQAALVSYSPEQEMETFWERALIPVVYCRLAAKYSYARVNDPKRPDAAANGQFILIRRSAYGAVGGHRAVAAEVLEDVALARRVKEAGYGIYFTARPGVVRTRMYRSFRALWEGWTKNLYQLMGASRGSMLKEILRGPVVMLILLGPLFVYGLGRGAWGWPAGGAVALLALAHLKYAAELHGNLLPVSLIQYYVPGLCLYWAALVASWWKTTHGSVMWKGRVYPAKASQRAS